jgi:carbon storage regulator
VLVLSRRVGESVVIGDGSPDAVTVTVLEVRGDVVRIGIDAPRSVAVHRAELLAELADANADAASPSETTLASLSEALRTARD